MSTELKDMVVQKLTGLTGNITGQDKKDACTKLKVSRPTLDKYLSGEVPNVDTGLTILEFFNGKISKRMDRLKRVA